ncbi:MAG: molybdenum cofactor guanylyltransferase [Sphingomonadaceae bacterium]|nr:molybdenum cofactor guanylyltransferase [Sphingomonadaceae bacterium]
MTICGAILAGGRSRRFGGDKAEALLDGKRLIDRVAEALSGQVDVLVICGREESRHRCLEDWPEPGLGPLGGLAAALHFAERESHDAVLSVGCDIPNLPGTLLDQLRGAGPGIADSQPVIGYWPVALSPLLDAFIAKGGRALYAFAEAAGGRRIAIDPPLANINRPADLEKFARRSSRQDR